jgi:ribA/ribD-fused uncharacterized protein
MTEINSFSGKYSFLSNMYPYYIEFGGLAYPSSENAYQAMKCADQSEHAKFTLVDPKSSKKLGRKVKMRSGWDLMKIEIMEKVLEVKFAQGNIMSRLLDETGDALLVEGNWWNDTFWGVCKGEGRNELGKLLMKIRSQNRLNNQTPVHVPYEVKNQTFEGIDWVS